MLSDVEFLFLIKELDLDDFVNYFGEMTSVERVFVGLEFRVTLICLDC